MFVDYILDAVLSPATHEPPPPAAPTISDVSPPLLPHHLGRVAAPLLHVSSAGSTAECSETGRPISIYAGPFPAGARSRRRAR